MFHDRICYGHFHCYHAIFKASWIHTVFILLSFKIHAHKQFWRILVFWPIGFWFKNRNGILLPKLFWPTVRKNCSSDREKLEFANFLRSLEQFVQTVKGQMGTHIIASHIIAKSGKEMAGNFLTFPACF